MKQAFGWIMVGFGVLGLNYARMEARSAPSFSYLMGSFMPGLLFVILGALLLRPKKVAPGEFVYDPDKPDRWAWAEAIALCRRQAELGILGGIVVLSFGTAITQLMGVEFFQAGTLIALAGWSLLVWGSARYMQYKGYSAWWGLFGMLVLLGLLILLCFPNRYRQRGELKDAPKLTTGEVGAAEGAKILIAELRVPILPVLSVAWLAVAGSSAVLFLILSRHDPTQLRALYGLGFGGAALAGALVRVTWRKRRHCALPTFAFLCLGVALVGPRLVRIETLRRNELFREAGRQFQADLLAVAGQSTTGTLPPFKSTGDPQVDAVFRPLRDLMNAFFGSLQRMNDRIAALDLKAVYADDVMTNAPALEAEIRKRGETRAILQEHQAAILEMFAAKGRADAARRLGPAARQALAQNGSLDMRAEIAALKEGLSLRVRHLQVESDLLEFLRASFGHYQVRGETISFDAQTNSDRYAELSQGTQQAVKALEAFQQRQQKALDAQERQLEQLAPRPGR